jgi:hypothetical protein
MKTICRLAGWSRTSSWRRADGRGLSDIVKRKRIRSIGRGEGAQTARFVAALNCPSAVRVQS